MGNTATTPMTDEEFVTRLRRSVRWLGHGKCAELVDVQFPASSTSALGKYLSDRWSAFEFKLPYPIPGKGVINNLTTIAVKRFLQQAGVRTDLMESGRNVPARLPFTPTCDEAALVIKRMTVVHHYEMIPYEIIVRGYALGSLANALEAAARKGLKSIEFSGHTIPTSVKRGQKLKVPLATPTTKAKVGHDENVSWQTVEDQYPGILAFGQKVFDLVSHWCESNGDGRLLDFKIEVAYDRDLQEFILCDEVSPDTCRLCLEQDIEALMRGESVEFYDKEFGRQYLASLGIRALDPENADDIAQVNLWTPEEDFIDEMQRRLEVGCRILTGGFTSQEFLRDAIGV